MAAAVVPAAPAAAAAAVPPAVPADGEAPAAAADAGVTPWEVTGKVDYARLVREFGCSMLTPDLIARTERIARDRVPDNPTHHFLRRGIFFSHRDFEEVLKRAEAKQPFYLYTGRGPSSQSMHLGHLIPFMFTKWLQDAFGVPLVIQLTDDEKYLWRGMEMAELAAATRSNARDIAALGFKPENTFMFSDFEYVGTMYRTVVQIQRQVTFNQVRGTFGFDESKSIGQIAFPAVQAAPAFSSSFPHIFPPAEGPVLCLVPQAIDQDNYFRMTRDVAPKLQALKPAVIHARFFPALTGDDKMSASIASSVIYLSDTDKEVDAKLRQSLSGGGDTLDDQRVYGANVDVDVPLKWMEFFEPDDAKLAKLRRDYANGEADTNEVKKALAKILKDLLGEHRRARAAIDDAALDAFSQIRPMGPALAAAARAAAAPPPPPAAAKAEAEGDGAGGVSKNAAKKAAKKAERKARQADEKGKPKDAAAQGGAGSDDDAADAPPPVPVPAPAPA